MLTGRKPLSPKPIRRDLTDREFCRALGGLLGGMSGLGDLDELRNAVKWWAENDQAWALLERQKRMELDVLALSMEGAN